MTRTPEGRFVAQGLPGLREARVCACGDHGFVGLTRGLVAFCDAEAVPLISGRKWRAVFPNGGGPYACTGKQSKGARDEFAFMHRLLARGGGAQIDHRDRDTLNNRGDNLRPCSVSQNQANRRDARACGRFKGVKTAPSGKYVASIQAYGQRHYLGSFVSAREAAEAYDQAAVQHFGEFALTNMDLGLLPSSSQEAAR